MVDGLPPRERPPHNVNVLSRWLTETSDQTGIAAGRLRRWVGFMVIAAMLDNVRRETDDQPLFLIKGGVAMELRFDTGARATKDLDMTFRDQIEAASEYLDLALRNGHGDFTATRTELETIRETGALRCEIKLAYRGKSALTVQLEIAGAEGDLIDEVDYLAAIPLDHVGLVGPGTVACLPVRWQIAQKLHAVTEVPEAGENDRFRDLIDLQLLGELLSPNDLPSVKEACVAVFERRGQQTWPPEIVVYPSWEAGYRSLAEETGFVVVDVAEAVNNVNRLISTTDDT